MPCFLGRIPALTANGTLYFGRYEVREKIAISQLVPHDRKYWKRDFECQSSDLSDYAVRMVGDYLDAAVQSAAHA